MAYLLAGSSRLDAFKGVGLQRLVCWRRPALPCLGLLQEFDVEPTRTVREEFYGVYNKQLSIVAEQERISKQLESVGEDMDKMQVGEGVPVWPPPAEKRWECG